THVVDLEEVVEIVNDWKKQAENPEKEATEVDADLATKLKAWNEKQTIVTYVADFSRAIAAFPDVSHAEAILWAKERVSRLGEEIARLEKDGWQPVVATE